MRNGQITILVLLLGLMGLTVALSSASRSLSDLKQVSYVDFGTKAFAAAEAGLQYGLNAFASNPGLVDCVNPQNITGLTINGINTTAGKFQYQICATGGNNFDAGTVTQDNVAELSLVGASPPPDMIRVHWDTGRSVEVVIVRLQAGTYSLRRYAFNATGVGSGNGFGSATCGADCYAEITGLAPQDQLVRIKPVYGSSRIWAEAFKTGGGGGQTRLQAQNYTVSAWAETTNGTKKKVQAVQSPPTLPSIFDYVLFSNSSITR